MMITNNNKTTFISLISGKGGAGKTVIGLSIAKILFEAKFKVLFVDCDFSTHGASYFFEDELDPEKEYSSFVQILNNNSSSYNILKTTEGFSFLPSTLDPVNTKNEINSLKMYGIPSCFEEYDYVIFDCQAGYSTITEDILGFSNKNVVVMEADAISSSALRVLYLQFSKHLEGKKTWQIFNKLTEDERKIYGKISDGTFFTNLPATPFDWKVRGAFALGKIPGLFEKDSVFGIAVFRFLKIILGNIKEKLTILEKEAIGDWHMEIISNIESFENEKEKISDKNKHLKQNIFQRKMLFLSLAIIGFSISISVLNVNSHEYFNSLTNIFSKYADVILLTLGVSLALLIQLYSRMRIKKVKEEDEIRKDIIEIEDKLSYYKTLLNTDDRLNEYVSTQYSSKKSE